MTCVYTGAVVFDEAMDRIIPACDIHECDGGFLIVTNANLDKLIDRPRDNSLAATHTLSMGFETIYTNTTRGVIFGPSSRLIGPRR